MPALSVVIPVYNAETTLSNALESVLRQGIDDYEIVLIDDGSTDNSGIIATKYVKSYPFIHYYKKENGGVCSARNMGLDFAQGDYITFMDNDDELEPGYYKRMLQESLSGKYDIIISGVTVIENGKEFPSKVFDDEVNKEKFAANFFEYNDTNLNAVWNKWFKRDLLNGIRFEYGRINAEDYLVCLEAFSKAQLIKFVPICGYRFIQNSESASHRLYKRYDKLHELDNSLEYRSITTNWYLQIGLTNLQIEEYHKRKDYIWFYHMVKNILNPGTPYKTSNAKKEQIRKIMDAIEPRYCIKHGYITGKLSILIKLLYLVDSPALVMMVVSLI